MTRVKFSRVLQLLQRHPWVEEVRENCPSVHIRLVEGRVFDRLSSDRERVFTSLTAALGGVRGAELVVPRFTATSAPRGVTVTPEMVDRALDVWFANPRWREVFSDGPDVRDYMTKSLKAALQN